MGTGERESMIGMDAVAGTGMEVEGGPHVATKVKATGTEQPRPDLMTALGGAVDVLLRTTVTKTLLISANHQNLSNFCTLLAICGSFFFFCVGRWL